MQFVEKDEAGNIAATYIESLPSSKSGSSRIDIVVRTKLLSDCPYLAQS